MASQYGIRLDVENGLTWDAFRLYVQGLLSADTRLSRHFAPQRG